MFLFLLTLWALDVDPATAAEQMAEKVIVTANRINENQTSVTRHVTIIDHETLAKNQYENLADLLQNYGFQITSYGSSQSSSQITLRGFSSSLSDPLDSNVQVLLNGLPIGTVNLAMIPAEGLERIEILSGPASVQYGSTAIGGVINIIPKQGSETFELSAEAGAGSWNSMRALGSMAGKMNNFDFSGAVGWNRQGSNYTTGDGDLYQDTEAKSRASYLVNLGYSFNENNRLGILLSGTNDWGLGQNQSLRDEQKYNGLDFEAKRINSSFGAAYSGGMETAGLNWQFRYFNAYDLYESVYPAQNPMFLRDNTIEVTQRGAQGQLSWQWNFMTLTGGIDYSVNRYSSGYAPAYSQDNTGVFALAKFSFLDNLLILTGGIRHDDYQFRVEDNSDSINNTAFSAGVAVNPLSWLTFKGNWAESFKMPSGLYVVGYEGTYGVEPNPDLKPERGYGWDAGLDIHYGSLKIDLAYFSTIYDNKFVSAYLDNGKSKYYNASGASWLNGMEGGASFDLGEFFEWDFSVVPYFRLTTLFNYADPAGKKLYNIRNLNASWGIDFDSPQYGLNASLKFNYLGYQQEMVFGDNYERLPDKHTGGKTVADFFISKTIYEIANGGKLSVKGEIRNITNENYAYRDGYPMPGRSFYCALRYDF